MLHRTVAVYRRPLPRRVTLLSLALLAALTGCAVQPMALTPDEVQQRAKSDTERMYADQVPITAPLTLADAMAHALKYNLDYRLKRMESALALGMTDQMSKDMLPQLVAKAGYRDRSEFAGGTSVGIEDGIVSTRPSSSEERSRSHSSVEFGWNALDFGVSYYRARQQGNQYLIAEERRRKVVQNLMQDVRGSYWRALAAQRLDAEADAIMRRASLALGRSKEAEVQRIVSPATSLAYQRALLDATTLLNQRRQDLKFAKHELSALMNVPPGVPFTLAESVETPLPDMPSDLKSLEDLALLQRPELREENLRRRINADEARKQVLGLLPGVSLQLGMHRDNNEFAYAKNWSEGGVSMAWNLMRLFSLPSIESNRIQQEKADETRRMALTMAVLTQARVGAERYRLALEDFRLADEAAQVDSRLAQFTQDSVTARLESDLEAIRTRARSVLGAYQRAYAYATAHIAYARLYNSLGFDPLPDGIEQEELPELARRVQAHLQAGEKSAFGFKSQLFGDGPGVQLQVWGIQDPTLRARVTALAKETLNRHRIRIDDDAGRPLHLRFEADAMGGVERATWTMGLPAVEGQTEHQARFMTTLPVQSRPAAYESSLQALLNTHMNSLKTWLGVN